MATVSILDTAEMIVLPFCTFVPIGVGVGGYILWKRGLFANGMEIPLMASSGAMTGMALFHVLFTLTGGGSFDPRFGLSAMGAAFCLCVFLKVCVCLARSGKFLTHQKNTQLHFEFAWVENESMLVDTTTFEVTDALLVDTDSYALAAPDMAGNAHNLKRRRFIAIATYLVIVFQSAFDGLVLKYNPNANDSGLQVGMFFASKWLESFIVATALIHAPVGRRWYMFYMTSFTITVGSSTLAAYELVSANLVSLDAALALPPC